MVKKVLIMVCLIAVFLLGLNYYVIPDVYHKDTFYNGQEVFLSQESYEAFKGDVKLRVYEDNLKLQSFDVLASEPPIIVNFSVSVPYDYEFPYGEEALKGWERGVITGIVVLFFGTVLIIIPIMLMLEEYAGLVLMVMMVVLKLHGAVWRGRLMELCLVLILMVKLVGLTGLMGGMIMFQHLTILMMDPKPYLIGSSGTLLLVIR